MKQAIFTLRGDLFNPVHFPLREVAEGADFPPSQWAKVCPFCLDPWSRLYYGETQYQIHSVPCQRCMPIVEWYWFPNLSGSLLYNTSYQSTDWDLLTDLPAVLLRRELDIHLKAFFLLENRTILMLTPEEDSQLQLYRARINAGEMIPIEDMHRATALLRSDRISAAKRGQASKAAKGSSPSPVKAKKQPVDPAALLSQLGIALGGKK